MPYHSIATWATDAYDMRAAETFTVDGSALADGWKIVIPDRMASVLLEYQKL